MAGDTNQSADVFIRDVRTHTTRRVSLSASGGQVRSHLPLLAAITGDGRFVAFVSDAAGVVPADRNGVPDVFWRGPLG